MYKLIFLAFLLVICSCNSPEQPYPINYSSSTSDYQSNDILSIRKSRDKDILHNLYKQAVKKDSQLQLLENELGKIEERSNDSLAVLWEFMDYNSLYYLSAERFAAGIIDSNLRSAVMAYLNKSDKKLQDKMAGHKLSATEIVALQTELDYQHMLMKIVITEELMQEYQKNEPAIEPLVNSKNELKQLIDKSKTYTKPFN